MNNSKNTLSYFVLGLQVKQEEPDHDDTSRSGYWVVGNGGTKGIDGEGKNEICKIK